LKVSIFNILAVGQSKTVDCPFYNVIIRSYDVIPAIKTRLNFLSDMLEKYPRRRVLLFKVMEEIMRNISPFNKQTRELLFA